MICVLCQTSLEKASNYVNWGWSDFSDFEDLLIYVCPNCGLGQSSPPIPSDRLSDFYSNHYRRRDSPFHLDFQSLRASIRQSPRAVAQISLLSMFRDLVSGSRVLDIGAGAGHTFATLNQVRNDLELFAIEPARDAANFYSEQFGVTSFQSLSEARLKNQSFDVVIMSHVLEHFNLDDVLPFLEELASYVSEEGLLLVEVPHEDYREEVVIRKVRNTPHLTFFTKSSLEICLTRAGYTPIFSRRLGEAFGEIEDSSVELHSTTKDKSLDFLWRYARNLAFSVARTLLPVKLRRFLRNLLTPHTEVLARRSFIYDSEGTILRVIARKNST